MSGARAEPGRIYGAVKALITLRRLFQRPTLRTFFFPEALKHLT